MKLKCISTHEAVGQYVYEPGDEIEVDEEKAAWLMADSPQSWVVVEVTPEVKTEPEESAKTVAPIAQVKPRGKRRTG